MFLNYLALILCSCLFPSKHYAGLICTPFTGQLVKGDFLCAIPMNAKNIALTCIGKGNILKHLKAFPKGVFAWWSADGAEVKKRNRVWTTEERFELVNRVLSGESFTSVAISAGICPGGLNTWIHKYKEMGYIGLIDRRKNRNPKESHMKKHKHTQPGRHKESEHEELIRLRSEIEFFKAQNEFFKTENEVIKKEIALREQKATARLKAKKQPSSRNSEPKDIDWPTFSKPWNCPVLRIILK